MEYLNDYSGLPSSLLDSALSYKSIMRSPPSCKTDRSDCTNDGCNADTSDCSVDGVNPCSRDSGCYDRPCSDRPCSDCSYDGICTYDTPVVRPTGNGSITVISTTETTITIRLASISNATVYHVVYRLASETATEYIDTTSTRVTISGLKPGTKYAINYRGINGAGTNGFMSSPVYATTDMPRPIVDKWNWGLSNGNASANATTAAYYAVRGNGLTSDFSYLVWNDMVDKVVEILDAKGLSWNSSFLSISATKMSSRDKTLTASRFNSLRYNIGLHYSTGINTVSKGDIVYGRYFITLTNCMNNWIDQ